MIRMNRRVGSVIFAKKSLSTTTTGSIATTFAGRRRRSRLRPAAAVTTTITSTRDNDNDVLWQRSFFSNSGGGGGGGRINGSSVTAINGGKTRTSKQINGSNPTRIRRLIPSLPNNITKLKKENEKKSTTPASTNTPASAATTSITPNNTTTTATGSNGCRSTSTAKNNSHAHNNNNVPLLSGSTVDHSVDFMSLRPGDRLDIPYELTVSETMQEFWHAAFYSQDRIHTSRPFCRTMGLQDRVIPFGLALFLASSMTHADAAKVQVGFGHVWYLWPTFAGDTFRKSFEVNSVRNTSDGNHSIISFTCDLYNHRGRLCMRADKRMLFSFSIPESITNTSKNSNNNHDDDDAVVVGVVNEPANAHLFRDHLLSKATNVLADQPSHTWARFHPGQCILHSMNRSLTFSQSQQLASLARLTHERHFDTKKFDRYSEILVPGGLVLGLALSLSARDLHEILHEEIVSVKYVNSLSPDQIVGAISYIERVDENNVPGELEILTVRTLGIKNMNVKIDLKGVGIPLELFQSATPKEIEAICKQHCPILMNKIVVQVHRKILRQSCREEVFLL